MALEKRNLSNIGDCLDLLNNIITSHIDYSTLSSWPIFYTEIFYNYNDTTSIASMIGSLIINTELGTSDIKYITFERSTWYIQKTEYYYYPLIVGTEISVYYNGTYYPVIITEDQINKWLAPVMMYDTSTSSYICILEEVAAPDIFLDINGVKNQIYIESSVALTNTASLTIENYTYTYNILRCNLYLPTDTDFITNIETLFNALSTGETDDSSDDESNTSTTSVETLLHNIAKVVQEAEGSNSLIKGKDLPIRIRAVINNGSNTGSSGGVNVSGSITITKNGSHDVSTYATAIVNVPINEISGSITITSNGTHIVAGYENAIVNVSTGGSDDVVNSIIDGTVTSLNLTTNVIGSYALYNCANLETVTGNFTSIGSYAFYGCSKLTNIDTSNMSIVNDHVFQGCSALKNIDISNATSIGEYSFQGCSQLTTVTGNAFTSIGTNAFYGCSKLTNIDISNVTTFNDSIFYECSQLTDITLNSNINTIPNQMFYTCTGLTNINLNNVTRINNHAFYKCSNLRNIDISNVTSVGDSAFANSGIEFTECIATSIGMYAFTNCDNIIDIRLPNFSGTLDNYTFQSCDNLKSVYIPNVTKFYANVFSNCPNLEAVIVTQTNSVCNPYTSSSSIFPFTNSPKVILYVDPSMLDSYKASTYYTGNNFTDRIKSVEEWYVSALNNIVFINNDTKTITLSLHEFTNIPTVDVSLSSNDIAILSNINIRTDSITFDLTPTGTIGSATLTISVIGDHTREISSTVSRVEWYEPTYTVENISTVYTFELNDDNYYESNNNKVGNSYSLAKLTFNNTNENCNTDMLLDCISSGESNYDFGILSNIDTTLTDNYSTDSSNVYKSFKGLSSTNVQTVTYENIGTGEHYIYIKYKKDGGSDSGNDSLQFKVRFECTA